MAFTWMRSSLGPGEGVGRWLSSRVPAAFEGRMAARWWVEGGEDMVVSIWWTSGDGPGRLKCRKLECLCQTLYLMRFGVVELYSLFLIKSYTPLSKNGIFISIGPIGFNMILNPNSTSRDASQMSPSLGLKSGRGVRLLPCTYHVYITNHKSLSTEVVK